MDEKKLEKILAKQTKELKADYARQGKFLLEEFDKRVQVIAEVQAEHSNKFKKIEDQLVTMNKRLDMTFDMVGKLVVDVEQLTTRVDRLEKQINKLSDDMEFVKDELKFIRNELQGKVDRSEFLALEKRVIVLEKGVYTK